MYIGAPIAYLSKRTNFRKRVSYKKRSSFFVEGIKKFLINLWDLCIKDKQVKNRGIAQLVEHRSPKPSVVSSNLTAPANKKNRPKGRFIFYKTSTESSPCEVLAKRQFPTGYTDFYFQVSLFYKCLSQLEFYRVSG